MAAVGKNVPSFWLPKVLLGTSGEAFSATLLLVCLTIPVIVRMYINKCWTVPVGALAAAFLSAFTVFLGICSKCGLLLKQECLKLGWNFLCLLWSQFPACQRVFCVPMVLTCDHISRFSGNQRGKCWNLRQSFLSFG